MAIILGTINDDVLNGGNGKDFIFGDLGNDRLFGRNGGDELHGGIGDDFLDGGNSNDQLDGGIGDDILDGGNGNDELDGGFGNDVFNAGRGADRLTTGDGLDVILIRKSGGSFDVVTDFDTAFDSIAVEAGISLKHTTVKDWNGDGIDDTVLQFSKGGSLVLLGVSDATTIDLTFGP